MAGRKPTVSDAEILQSVATAPDPFVTAPDLTDELDMTRQGVLKRLKELNEKGLLNVKEAGNTLVFYLSDDGRRYMNEHSET